MPISCHEKREKTIEFRPIGPEQAFRYPIDTLSIPDFRKTSSRFASHLDAPGPIQVRIGPTIAHMRGHTFMEADAANLHSTPMSARVGKVASDEALNLPKGPQATVKSVAQTPDQQRFPAEPACPGPVTTLRRCSHSTSVRFAGAGPKSLPCHPIPQFGMRPGPQYFQSFLLGCLFSVKAGNGAGRG